MTARNLKKNETGIIKEIRFNNKQQHYRMMDLGFIPNTLIKCYAKTFGTVVFEVKGGMYAIRNEDAEKIILESYV
jgi:Fe2+ transport system protein FeoA